MAQQNIKPKYILKGPRKEKVTMTLYAMKEIKGGKAGNTFEMVPEVVTEVRDCWMLYLPHGKKWNSIRIISEEQLKALNLGGDTPLIDMETGEVVGSLPHMAKLDYGSEDDLVVDETPSRKTKVSEGV